MNKKHIHGEARDAEADGQRAKHVDSGGLVREDFARAVANLVRLGWVECEPDDAENAAQEGGGLQQLPRPRPPVLATPDLFVRRWTVRGMHCRWKSHTNH